MLHTFKQIEEGKVILSPTAKILSEYFVAQTGLRPPEYMNDSELMEFMSSEFQRIIWESADLETSTGVKAIDYIKSLEKITQSYSQHLALLKKILMMESLLERACEGLQRINDRLEETGGRNTYLHHDEFKENNLIVDDINIFLNS
jgi:hypothetical protein